MAVKFEHTFQVAWGDLDANRHLRNTAYLDYAAQTRMLYLASVGFTPAAFAKHHIGPIVFDDHITYHKELLFLEHLTVTVSCGGLNESGSKFVLVNRVKNDNGDLCASVRSHGAWFDLQARRVSAPPEALKAAMEALAHDDEFETL